MLFRSDAHSGKVVGYSIGATENTATILAGLKDAITSTGCLPYEILSDNHSFNKTKEAERFKATIEATGTTWRVSQNPRYKSFVERSFKTFGEKFCKHEYGYVGEGIRTRNKDGRTSQELFDQYTKSGGFLTEDQIKLIAIKLVDEYNNKADKSGKSRADRFADSLKERAFSISRNNLLRLFGDQSESTIRRGQIDIQRGAVKHEFVLSAAQYMELNNKKVRVRFDSLEEVHLFDLKTDCYIATAQRKEYAHGALASQTDDDILQFNKHKGRIAGIKAARKNKQLEIYRAAEAIDPEAVHAMNKRLVPKNIIEAFEANSHLRAEAERRGINLDTVTNMPVFSEVKTHSPEKETKAERRRRESPFSPKNHVFREIKDTDTI